jgi:diguanylate cyclase (GGDEF)-like protein
MSILFTVARIPYVIYLSTTNDVINEFYMHQVLQASLGILIFMIVIAFYDYVISSEINYSTSLKKLAETDPLTNLYNRKVFDDYMNSKKLDNHCLALLDIDNFKKINDQFGHPKGDEVLKEFSQCMEQELDESSTLFRWGGEEFAIISDSPKSEFNVLLESFRSNLEHKDFELGRPVTVSIGYVCLSDFENPMKAMIEADDALYQAKSNGKNQVVRAKS